MKLRQIKKDINRIKKRWKGFFKKSGIDIHLVYDDPSKYIGIFSTFDYKGKLEKGIFLNMHWLNINNRSFNNFIMLHELAHAIDYEINNGWRVDSNNEILMHDEIFKNITILLGIPPYENPWYKINSSFKKRQYKQVPTINLELPINNKKVNI